MQTTFAERAAPAGRGRSLGRAFGNASAVFSLKVLKSVGTVDTVDLNRNHAKKISKRAREIELLAKLLRIDFPAFSALIF